MRCFILGVLWSATLYAQWNEWESYDETGYSLQILSMDGLYQKYRFYPSKSTDSKIHVLLMSDGASSDLSRETLAKNLQNEFHVWISPCRHSGRPTFLGASYHRAISVKYTRPFFEKKPFVGKAYFDHTDFEFQFPDMKGDPDKIVAIIPYHSLKELSINPYFTRKFAKIIILSPPENIMTNKNTETLLQNSEILWIAHENAKYRLNRMKIKWGGDVKTYFKAGHNYQIFMRNHLAMGDISDWIKQKAK